jgi:hypothetical protein
MVNNRLATILFLKRRVLFSLANAFYSLLALCSETPRPFAEGKALLSVLNPERDCC